MLRPALLSAVTSGAVDRDDAGQRARHRNALKMYAFLLAAAVARQLIRLDVGGPNPLMRALLLVQGVEAQVHGAVLEPLPGVSVEAVEEEVRGMWLGALRAGPR